LYVEGSGAILPSDHPDCDFEFHDSFSIAGGTGAVRVTARAHGLPPASVETTVVPGEAPPRVH